jgi:hypothetical protein
LVPGSARISLRRWGSTPIDDLLARTPLSYEWAVLGDGMARDPVSPDVLGDLEAQLGPVAAKMLRALKAVAAEAVDVNLEDEGSVFIDFRVIAMVRQAIAEATGTFD